MILSLEGNPCQTQPNYRSAVLEYCTQLCQLDGETLGSQERRAAGHEVDSDNDSDGDDNDDDNDNDDGDIGAGISNRQDAFDTEIIGTVLMFNILYPLCCLPAILLVHFSS